jgi:hypothetical protein
MHPDPPASLCKSIEADVCPLGNSALADVIDGAIGELSQFQDTFGYYAHGVGIEAATLPVNWTSRAILIRNENTYNFEGLCLHPLDIAISKLRAAREKDIEYVREMVKAGYVTHAQIVQTSEIELGTKDRRIVQDVANSIGIRPHPPALGLVAPPEPKGNGGTGLGD